MGRIFHTIFPWFILLLLLASCSGTKKQYSPQIKFSAQQLSQDLEIAWTTLKKNHPGYDLHTPADSIDAIFAKVKASITDSLSEPEFRLRLAFAVAAIRCGHTSISASKGFTKYMKTHKSPQFPLAVKVWGKDSMVVVQQLTKDSLPIRRGSIVTAIDSIPPSVFIAQMKQYISTDGFSDSYKEIQISTTFPTRFKWMYGLADRYKISYIDSSGIPKSRIIPIFDPAKPDTLKKGKTTTYKPPVKKKQTEPKYGRLKFKENSSTAILELNNFNHTKVPSLIRKSFKQIRKKQVQNLVLDLRLNGGGRIEYSTLLTRYISDKPFRAADSVSAKDLRLAYPQYTQTAWLYKYFRWTFSKKLKDGRWHMQQTERQVHKPKKKNHFSGNLYVITSGLTFSASTLFLSKVYTQPNVTIVGEETGGGARGNSAVFTPRVTLPNTGVRLRLPIFRIVSDINIPANGRGIIPNVEVRPDSRSIQLGKDKKMEKVMSLIMEK